MSHTIRVYNKRLKKAQRYYLDKPMLDETGYIRMDRCVGFPLTHRSWICMGKCPQCRDPNREPRLVRKRKKEQLRFELKSELDNCQSIDI